jgi:putative transposase
VTPVKYRKAIFGNVERETSLVKICPDIAERYHLDFDTIGLNLNHVHYLISAAPKYSPSDIMRITKSITAKQLFKRFLDLRKNLWGGQLWSDGFYVGTVSQGRASKDVIEQYIKQQGQTPSAVQLKLLDA